MKYNIYSACALFAMLISCGPQGTTIDYEGEIVSQEQVYTSESITPKLLSFKAGEDVKLGDFVIKVNKVSAHNSRNEFLMPEPGNKFVAVEVEYYNPTQDKQIEASPMDWILFDNEDYAFEFAMMADSKKPELNMSTTVNPNRKVKGWVTFEIPNSSVPQKIMFQPAFGSYANVEISLN